MNPQHLPPQQYGGPPQQFRGPSPGFAPNGAPPNTIPQSYQNIPLGPQKPPQGDHLPPLPNNNLPPTNQPGQYPHSGLGAPVARSQIPSNQLPPLSVNDVNNFVKNDNLPSTGLQNGPPSFQNGPPQFQMSGTLPPTSQPLKPPTNFVPQQPNQNQFGPPSQSIQNAPPRPPSTQSNLLGHQPPLIGSSQSQFGQQPSQLGQPPSQLGQPTSQLGQPSSQLGQPPSQLGQPPLQLGQPPSQLGQPPSQLNQPPSQLGQPPSQLGQPPSQLGQTPLQIGQPPSQIGQPPSQVGQPLSQRSQPTSQHQTSQLGQPPSQLGQPPSQFGQPPSQMSHPPSQLGQQPQLNQPPSHLGQPPQLNHPPSQLSQPILSGGPSLPGGPQPLLQSGPPSQFSQSLQQGPPNLGPPGPPPPSQSGPFPIIGQHNGPNQSSSNQYGPSPSMQGPPKPGQYPSQARPGQPPMQGGQSMPGQNPLLNVSGPYAPSSGPQMPTLPEQALYSNQLSNQMQGINLSGPKQFSGPVGPAGPMRGGINGDTGPHMPPMMTQSGFVNGQQVRASPGLGYPPMPGKPPLSGQPPLPGQAPLPGQPALPGQPSLAGQPPLPGQGQYPNTPGSYPQPNYQQPQQNRRLDPDQMPSPIQVTQDDQQNRSGVFVTNQKGLVPPLVTTNFVVQDQGNCSPRFIRSSMYNVPITQDIVKQTAVPFSLVISPMARHVDQEYPPPIVNFGTLGPVRCIRCKAYMCPFMQFVDSGRRFQCMFCMATTDVPTEYFQHLDHTGLRMDRYERPELILGTYEFVATADYCRNNTLPKSPAIIFVIDVSYNNIKSGMVNLLCSQIKEIIQYLPVDQGQEKSNMKVGFITYNSSVHFYNIKGTLAAPQMLVVGDVQEMFMPLLDGFLCTPEESGPLIDLLMQQIPTMFADTRETETVLLPAIQAGLEALKASECAGKLLVFHSTLPSAEAPGKLKNRDDRKVLGTDKEKTILTPQTQAYNQLGQDCVGAGCSVDLFIFNNSYIDLATIGQVSRLTGGEIFKYTYFQADLDGERLINDIIMDISRPIAFDAVMRVRTSTGVRPTDFYGHFYMSNTTDIELAAIDCDKAIGVEVKHDDKLSDDAGVYIQAALLYTSCSGQRRLRILNLSLKTCSQMADLYRSCDLDTLINYISKQACYKLLDNNPKAVKDSIVNRAAQILATYRKNCASPSSAGQLILPECMKLLPLYVNCLLKNDAMSGGSDMTIDDRSFVMQAVMTMDVPSSVYYFYPRLIPLHDLDLSKDPVAIPSPIRCTIDKMNEQGVYILENGIHMFLWFGLGVNPDIIQNLFGAPSAVQVDIDRVHLPELDNPLSSAVRNIIDEIRMQRHRHMRLTLVRQREKLEPIFKHFLIEDRGNDGTPSYVDFLCHMHKEIRNLLS